MFVLKRIVYIESFCPEKNDLQEAKVTFAEIWMVGNPSPGYKATSIHCEYASEHGCSYNANCPLLKEAQTKLI